MPPTPKATTTGTQYRFIGDHATELDMGDGVLLQVGPGDFVDLTQDQFDNNTGKNEWLLDTSKVVPTKEELDAFKEAHANTTPTQEEVSADAK